MRYILFVMLVGCAAPVVPVKQPAAPTEKQPYKQDPYAVPPREPTTAS